MKKLLIPTYIICGILFALPICFDFLPLLSFINLIPIMIIESKITSKKGIVSSYFRGLLFFMSFNILNFLWFSKLYPLDFVGLNKFESVIVIILACLVIPFIESVTFSFIFVLYHLIDKHLKTTKLYIVSLFSIPALYIIFEWVQTLYWLGLPWAKLALTQTGFLPFLQSISLFGPYFLSFLIISLNILLTLFVLKFKVDKKVSFAYLAAFMLIFALNVVYGSIILTKNDKNVSTINVASIQGNISSIDKWNSSVTDAYNIYIRLSKEAIDNKNVSVIVWPETALPLDLRDSSFEDKLKTFSSENNVDLFIGAFNSNATTNTKNVIYHISPIYGLDDTIYVKQKLVPFGEYLPWRNLLSTLIPSLSKISMLSDDLDAGTSSSIFDTSFGKVGSIICFDSIYEEISRNSAKDGAEILFVSTNDSWFYDSFGVYEHNRHSVLRAVENNRYFVRSANTGISSIISNKGEVIEQTDPLVEDYLTSEVNLIKENSLYTKIGNIILYLAILYLISVIIPIIYFERKNNGKRRKFND